MARRQRPVEWKGLQWEDVAHPTLGTVNAFAVILANGVDSFEPYTQPTLTRLVGRIYVRQNAVVARTAQRSAFALGFILEDEDISPSDPSLEYGHPWLWTEYGMVHAPLTMTQRWNGSAMADHDEQSYGSRLWTIDFDIRTQRIVKRDQELRLCVATTEQVGGALPRHSGFLRALIKE